MTLQDTNVTFSSIADGTTTDFPMSACVVYSDTHVIVRVDGQLRALGTHYIVTNLGSSAGANVQFLTPPENGQVVLRARRVPYEQQTDLENYEGPPLEVIERQFDLCVMQSQQLADFEGRSIRFPQGENVDGVLPPLSDSAGKYLFRNLDGTIGAAEGTTDTPISGAMTPFVASDTLGDARGELNVYSKSEVDALVSPEDFSPYNPIRNGGMVTPTPNASITAGNQVFGGVEHMGFLANAFTTATGTLSQSTAQAYSSTTFAVRATITTTGNGAAIFIHRIPTRLARALAGKKITVSCKLWQASGGNITPELAIWRANSGDDYSAVTQIGTNVVGSVVSSGAHADQEATFDLATYDGNTGLVFLAAFGGLGALTDITFRMADLKIDIGEVAQTFYPEPMDVVTPPLGRIFAWASFQGTTSPSVRVGENISSITRNGSGDYTLNFLVASPDTNYAFVFGAGRGAAALLCNTGSDPSTTSLRVGAFSPSSAFDAFTWLNVVIYRRK